MDNSTAYPFRVIKRSWKSIATCTIILFIAVFVYLSFQKTRYEMTIAVPSALENYSFDSTSLTELIRQYSMATFSGGILEDLKKKYGEKWNGISAIRKRDLVITQRGNIFIIHARSTDSQMSKELGETMAAFIRSTKGEKINDMKNKARTYAEMEQRLKNDLTASDAIMKTALESRNLTNMIGFYGARESNYNNLLSVDQLLLQADKHIQINDFLEKNTAIEPHPIDQNRLMNALLAGFFGLLISTFFAFLALPPHKQ